MSVALALLMAVTAALLAAAVCAVLWRGNSKPAEPAAAPYLEGPQAPSALPAMDQPDLPAYAPPEDALWTAQLEVNQTFYVQTVTAKYVLTLLDPATGRYDAVRIGPKRGKMCRERFQMLFKGTFVPYQGLRHWEFIPGGTLCYQKIRGGEVLDMSPSTKVLRIFYALPEARLQQAS